ncbi:hypothetical protein [Eoetvoesiella caeni]
MNFRVLRESTVNWRLANPNGNHKAVQEICRLAAEQYRALALAAKMELDDIGTYLTTALDAVSDGEKPNVAFQWSRPPGKRGRPNENNAHRDWCICLSVRELMCRGESWSAACEAMSKKYPLHTKSIQTIAKGVNPRSILDLPEDIYPLPKKK